MFISNAGIIATIVATQNARHMSDEWERRKRKERELREKRLEEERNKKEKE